MLYKNTLPVALIALVGIPCTSMQRNVPHNTQSSQQQSLLEAVIARDHNIIKILIKEGAGVNQHNQCLVTPLMIAARDPVNLDTMKLLLDAHADPNLVNSYNMTAAYYATSSDALQLLIDADIDLGICKNKCPEETPLSECNDNAPKSVHVLIRPSLLFGIVMPHKINYSKFLNKDNPFEANLLALINYQQIPHVNTLNQQDTMGATLLMYAAALGNIAAVKFLLDRGANSLLKNHKEKTAKDLVRHILTYPYLSDQRRTQYQEIITMLAKPSLCYITIIQAIATTTPLIRDVTATIMSFYSKQPVTFFIQLKLPQKK